jgi:hypothetical protein
MSPIDRDRSRRRAGLAPRATLARIACAACAACLTGLAVLAPPAWARSEKILAYPRDQAWPTAVRFLAVDAHVKITEKDADAGYLMFELRDDGKIFRGSLEIMTVTRDGRSQVRFVLQIADRPSWLELAMLARLEDKLRAELGSPQPPPSPPPPPKKDEPGAKDPPGDGAHHDDGPPVSTTP